MSNTKFNFKSDSIHLYGRLDPFNNDILTENSTKSEIDNYLNEILHTNIFNLFNNIKSPNEKFINAISESKEFSPQNVMPDNIITVIKKHDENKNFVDIGIADK